MDTRADQGELFDRQPRPYVPHVAGSETSKAAADAMPDERVNTLREQVYQAIKASGDHGRTDDELQVELEMEGSTQRPRRIELLQRKRIIESGVKRATRTGRLAVVWVVNHAD